MPDHPGACRSLPVTAGNDTAKLRSFTSHQVLVSRALPAFTNILLKVVPASRLLPSLQSQPHSLHSLDFSFLFKRPISKGLTSESTHLCYIKVIQRVNTYEFCVVAGAGDRIPCRLALSLSHWSWGRGPHSVPPGPLPWPLEWPLSMASGFPVEGQFERGNTA